MSQPQQFLFVSHRDINIGSTLGYSIEFAKGKPTHVPRAMHATVMEKGCLPCDKDGKILDNPEAVSGVTAEAKVLIAPEDADERAEKIREGIMAIVKRNNSHDFSGGGVPSASTLTAALGWKVDQKEVRAIWDKVKPTLGK